MKKYLLMVLLPFLAAATSVVGPGIKQEGTVLKEADDITQVSFSNLSVASILVGSGAFSDISAITITANTVGIGTTDPTSQLHIVLRGTDSILVDGSTNERNITLGADRRLHTAGTNGTRAMNFTIDNNNQYDTHAVNVNWIATGTSEGDYNHVYDTHIDTANSTGGDVGAYSCSQTGSGLIEVDCLDAYPGVSPIEQHSGTLTQADNAFLYNVSFTNVTSAFRSENTNVTLFVANGNYIYLGYNTTFDDIEINLNSFASGAGIKPTFQYSAGGGSWTTFNPTDGSNGFRQNGNVTWPMDPISATWVTDTVNGIAGKYWVRIQRNQNNVTSPVEKTIKIVSSTMYRWDENGLLTIGTIKSGDSTNYSEFEADGTYKMNGTATVFEDYNFAGIALGNPSAAPDAVNFKATSIKVRCFDGNATSEELHGGAEMFHKYKERTNITPHIHWAPSTANAGNVKWNLNAVFINGTTVTASKNTSIVRPAGGTAWREAFSSFSSIDGSNITIENQVGFRIYRDPTDSQDTYPDDACIAFSFGFHYETDTLGSRTISTK